jgi:beta-galactosidase
VEPYKADGMTAFHGKVLAIVQSDARSGPITIEATSPGLRTGRTSVLALWRGAKGPGGLSPVPPAPVPSSAPGVDASYSGRTTTVPAAMVDGDLTTRWSNAYAKQATQVLPAVSSAHASDWVSVAWPQAREVDGVTSYFTVDGSHQLPASVRVEHWDGVAWVPASNVRVEWATVAGRPSRVAFDPVTTSRVRLTMTSRAPGTPTGFLGIDELQVIGGP